MKRATKLSESFVATYLRRHPLYAFGFVYVGLSLALAVVGPLIVPHSPTTSMTGAVLLPPSSTYWFGTDSNAMDVFSRTIAAYRTDLILAFAGAALSMLVGAPLGVYAGFFDGRGGLSGFLARVILRVEDVLQAFPIFVLALLLVAAFGPQPVNLVLAIVVANHISNLRLARSEVLTLRDRTFVEAARASGGSNMRIAFNHLLPNALNPVIAMLSTVMGFGILLIAGLSFVGAGVRVPTPEWGSMIAIGGPSIMTGQWWPSFFPGVFMAITIFSYSVVGEAVTALLDPLERIRMGYAARSSETGDSVAGELVDAQVAIANFRE
jgi:ABC-type dipeptide/oligopeptide/nickel transport systems, permease components